MLVGFVLGHVAGAADCMTVPAERYDFALLDLTVDASRRRPAHGRVEPTVNRRPRHAGRVVGEDDVVVVPDVVDGELPVAGHLPLRDAVGNVLVSARVEPV